MFRFFLVLVAIFLAMRIVRSIMTYLFPPIDSQNRSDPGLSRNDPPKEAEYSDVQDAKFKDLS